jgi:motility quorum-sensing regulator/GCU-specific mRNA interferase toxin
MEKHVPHYPLDAIKAEIKARGKESFTYAAAKGYRLLGLNNAQALEVVTGLERAMFFKSMTTIADHRVWQDVYHALCPNGRMAYIKFTLRTDGAVVIQFKEK